MAKTKLVKDTSERWLLTYSDLMNLLLILFIILYVSSKADAAKFQQVAQSLREGFNTTVSVGSSGPGGTGDGLAGASDPAGGSDGVAGMQQYWAQSTEETGYESFYSTLTKLLSDYNIEEKVSVLLDDRGVVISFLDNALFDPGSADIDASSQEVVLTIGRLLTKLPYSFILVEGHTDTVPIHNAKYIDNMDLSTQRASNVWRLLVSSGLAPEKLASIGYGEYRPVAPNDTAENKSKNRRVVISILKEHVTSDSEISAAEAIIPHSKK